MTVELQSQLRAYAEHVEAASSPVTTNDVLYHDPAARGLVRGPRLPVPAATKLPGWAYAIAAAVAIVLLIGGISWVLGPRADAEPVDQPPITTPAPSIHAPTDDASTLPTETITTGLLQWWMSPPIGSHGAIWIGDVSGETVLRLDATTRAVTDRIPVATCATCGIKLIATESFVWALTGADGELVRIDPNSREVVGRTRVAPGEVLLSADRAIWVVRGGSLNRIDIDSGESTGVFRQNNHNSWWAGEADGALWSFSALTQPPQVTRFDLAERTFDGVDVDIPITEECCIATDDAIWLISHTGIVLRLDTSTLEVSEVASLDPGLRRGIAAAGALWLPNAEEDAIYRLDLALGEVTDIIPVCCEPLAPLFAEDAIWVPNQRRANVTRIDVTTLEVTHIIEVGARPVTPIFYDGALWVASAEDGTVTRIELP